jgi:hypothetical protein
MNSTRVEIVSDDISIRDSRQIDYAIIVVPQPVYFLAAGENSQKVFRSSRNLIDTKYQ